MPAANNRNAEAVLEFGGQDRLFRLGIGPTRALQERTDCGPYELYLQLSGGTWKTDHLKEILRQGLIGGGLPVVEADKLLRSEFDTLPKLQFVPLASAILMAELMGVEDEPPGERKARKPTAAKPRSRATKSGSAPSTS